jgi:pimeloyl-ACP methyl ester carboxylesterase
VIGDTTAILDTPIAREYLPGQRVHIVAFSLGTWLGAAAAARAAGIGRPVASVSPLVREGRALGVQQGPKVAKRLGDRARYVELPEAGHVNLMDQPETADAVRAMIASHGTPASR